MVWERFRYDGKRVLVSGGATGMGAAVAKLVAELGGEVVVADIQPVDFAVDSVEVDLRQQSSIDAALASVGAPIHALFSCAGVSGAPFSPVDVMLANFVGRAAPGRVGGRVAHAERFVDRVHLVDRRARIGARAGPDSRAT